MLSVQKILFLSFSMQGTFVFQCSCIIGLRSCSICLSVGLEDHQYLFSGGGHSPILCWILLGESGPSLMQNCIFQGLGIPFYSAHPPPLRKGPESRDVDLWNLTWLFSSVIQLSLCSCFPIARQIVCKVSTEISVRAKGKGGRYSLFLAMQCFNDAMFSCFDHAIFMWCLKKKHCQRHNGPRVLSLYFELPFRLNWICIHFSFRDDSSFRLNTLGPLCLWQCF